MKNLTFKDNELKKTYKTILNSHPALSGIMIREFNLTDNTASVEEIINDLHGINIVVNSNNNLVIVTIKFIGEKIEIDYPNLPYKTVYTDCRRKYIVPAGYEYENGYNGRRIFKEYNVALKQVHTNEYHLILEEGGRIFNIVITGEHIDIIEELLNYNHNIINIRDLLKYINSRIDLSYFYVKLSDDIGGIIEILYGNLIKYVEYRDTEKETQKIFLQNNEFLIERRIKEKCDDEVVSFMKKIGVYNGEENRKD